MKANTFQENFIMAKKTALITGGAGALGSKIALAFSDAGYKVIIGDREESAMEEIVSAAPDRITSKSVDLLNENSIVAIIEYSLKEGGSLDAFVNTVGGWSGGKEICETAESEWDKMMLLNAKTAFLASKFVFSEMKQFKTGLIVNIGSIVAHEGGAGAAAYSASKAAVISLTRSLAEEGKNYGIRANSFMPSMIDTPANRHSMPDADYHKWVSPDSIAEMAVFLASEKGKSITGASIPFAGGML